MSRTRSSVLAGSWYPGDPQALANEVDGYLSAADLAQRPAGHPRIAVVPHAGYGYSGESAGKLYGLLDDPAPGTIFILAPNHRAALDRIALTSHEAFATPLGEVPVDQARVQELAAEPGFTIDDAAHASEHAVEIQLPFLQRLWPDSTFSIVPMLVPHLESSVRTNAATALGRILTDLLDEDSLLIVSSDFTHYGSAYGFVPFKREIPEALERLDAGAILKILAADPQGLIDYGRQTGITMCGLQAAAVALETGLPAGYEAALIDYRRSGDRDGDYSLSVSYASILMSTGPGRIA